MAERTVIGAGALPGAAHDVRSGVTTLRGSVEDLDAYLRGFAAAWSGQAAGSFATAYGAWSRAATDLRADLDRLAALLDLAEGNYAAATRAGVRRWSGAAPGAVVAMGAAAGGDPTVVVSLPELAAAARGRGRAARAGRRAGPVGPRFQRRDGG